MSLAAVSRRAQEITPFLVMDILERAQELERQGVPVIHLEVGQPDWDTPQVVKEAAFAAMQRGETQYTHSMGLLDLRQAICRHYEETYGVSLTPERIIVTSGTSPAMLLILAALLDPGDEIILTDPITPVIPISSAWWTAWPATPPSGRKTASRCITRTWPNS